MSAVERYEDPYLHYVLRNVFEESYLQKLITALRDEQLHGQFSLQNSDLFTFLQCDIEKTKNPLIRSFVSFLHSPSFIEKIAEIVGISVSRIDVSAFIFEKTHHLLPHDDRMPTRRIAYVINLSTLAPADGGSLALYEMHDGDPSRITKRISPQSNSIILFPVTLKSFHEVEEVVADTQRITITGWLHD